MKKGNGNEESDASPIKDVRRFQSQPSERRTTQIFYHVKIRLSRRCLKIQHSRKKEYNMDKILEALYKGKIRPYENLAPTDPEFHTLKEQYLNEMEYFKSILKAEDYERLNNLEEISDTLTEMEHVEAFSRGFRLAAKLVGEAYYNKDELPDFLH